MNVHPADPHLYERKVEALLATFETKVVTFEGLFSEIGAGTGFTLEQLLGMASEQEDAGEGLFINHGDEHFFVPYEKLKEFFSTHEKPKRRLSVKEENAFLKRQMAEMKAEMERLRGGAIEPPKEKFTIQTAADVAKMKPRVELPEPTEGLDDEPIPAEKPADMSQDALQDMLKGQISGSAPYVAKKG